MTTISVVESFRDAFAKFIYLCDHTLTFENAAHIFKDLKKEKKFVHANEKQYWRGNHDQGQMINTIYLIDQPLRFYVVEAKWVENSADFQGEEVERWVFVPEKE